MSMTKQEIFDEVVTHLRTQKAQSMRGVVCAYRGANNCKCAIGILIKDEEYNPDWDAGAGNNITNILRACPSLADRLGAPAIGVGEVVDFLADLQEVHDDNPVENWEYCFHELADAWMLDYTPVQSETPTC